MNRNSAIRDNTANQRAMGAGLPMRWQCFGCHQVRDNMGSRGAGIKKRCAVCVAKRNAA